MKKMVPKTETPRSVFITLMVMAILLWLVLFLLFLYLFGNHYSVTVGTIAFFILIGLTTEYYTEGNIPAYNAVILISQISGEMRVVFPGVNLKLPWEEAQKNDKRSRDLIDLRYELSDSCEETYTTLDGMMLVKYVYTMKIDTSGKFMSPSEAILLFRSFETNVIKGLGKATFSQLYSDYYGKNENKNLLNKEVVDKAVIYDTNGNQTQKILDFERGHGVIVEVRLEDSDYDKETQKYKDMVSQAESFADAIKKLKDKGVDPVRAENIVKLINSERYNQSDYNINLDAKGLENLRQANIFGTPPTTKTKKS